MRMDETDLCCCCMIEYVASHRIKLNTTNVLNLIYLLLIQICHRHDEKVGIIQQKYCNVADYCEFWLEKMKAFCYTSVECFLFVGHFNNIEVFFLAQNSRCTCTWLKSVHALHTFNAAYKFAVQRRVAAAKCPTGN